MNQKRIRSRNWDEKEKVNHVDSAIFYIAPVMFIYNNVLYCYSNYFAQYLKTLHIE